MKINAQDQFTPSTDSVTDILGLYSLDLLGYQPAASGIENITLLATTTTGEYVLRVYRRHKKADEDIELEIDFMAHIAANGIPVPLPIYNQDQKKLTKYQGWQAILTPREAGRHPGKFNSKLAKALATTQAEMHHLATAYHNTAVPDKPLTTLEDTIFLPKAGRTRLSGPAANLIEKARSHRLILPPDLPSGLCHLDYDVDNILVDERDNITAVLDFDDLAYAPFAVCLAYTLWRIIIDEDFSLLGLYLNDYEQNRRLSSAERTIIPEIVLFRHYMMVALQAVRHELDEETALKYSRLEKWILNWSV